MTKKKEVPAKEKQHKWRIETFNLDEAESKLTELEIIGFEIISVTPIAGSFGVHAVIVAKKEVQS